MLQRYTFFTTYTKKDYTKCLFIQKSVMLKWDFNVENVIMSSMFCSYLKKKNILNKEVCVKNAKCQNTYKQKFPKIIAL